MISKIFIFLPCICILIGCSTSSIYTSDYENISYGHESHLKKLSIGILKNPSREFWDSEVDGHVLDIRKDENELLYNYIKDLEIFGKVFFIESMDADVDYIISCSVDCKYSIKTDGTMYFINTIMTLGIGYLLGLPYQDSQASYVVNAVFYDNRGNRPDPVSGTLAYNYKNWYFDNMYWRPDFYSDSALEPLFERVLYDFLAKSGCLE